MPYLSMLQQSVHGCCEWWFSVLGRPCFHSGHREGFS